MNQIHRVYFIGIGGIGMSALARYFQFKNKAVAGYDKTETPLTRELAAMGMSIHYQDDIALVPDVFKEAASTLIVYTPAVPADHSEYRYFKEHGFRIQKRSEVLGLITRDSFCLAVAGTHGKTTTSAILAHLLKETGTSFTAFLGGISEDFDSNFVFEGDTYTVVEADEFDRSFLRLTPNVACITSMDADHLDIYGSSDTLQVAFGEFAEKLKPGGQLFVKSGLPIAGTTYGIADGSDYCVENIKVDAGTYVFDVRTPDGLLRGVRFHKPGRHNLLNGLAALAMGMATGAEAGLLAGALETFKGVRRRFSYQIKRPDMVFIDDYAHHPTEIDAVWEAIAEMHPGKRTVAVFQPHLFSRTRDFGAAFAKSLSRYDVVLLLDIYPARETPIAGIDSAWLLDQIESPVKKLITKADLVAAIKDQRPEVLVTMGAGDIGLEVATLKMELEHA